MKSMTKDAGTMTIGTQELSKFVYFENDAGQCLRPIYQKDDGTGVRSYRVYINGGNKKDSDERVQCYKELAKLILDGHPVRCRLADGASSNRSISSRDVKRLVVEKVRT